MTFAIDIMDWAVHLLDHALAIFVEQREPLLRLCLAAGLGAIIGLEREASGKPAGFRTNLLICLGAALVTELSAFVARDVSLPGGVRSDPGRISAQVVSGIGFLGAGTIMQARGSISGLTTAATLWVVAAIGMAVGAGAYVHAVVGATLVMVALRILARFEDHLLARRPTEHTIRIVLEPNAELIAGLEQQLVQAGYRIRSLDVEKVPDALVASFAAVGVTGNYDRAARTLFARAGVRQVTLS
jgi:putative Mg2+ transporter-C (MgtC) family protein